MQKAYVMEFLGTFFLILTIALGLHPFAIASMLMAWIYIGKFVSGAHYNPMLSLALMLRGSFARSQLLPYIFAQSLGGFAAFMFAATLHGNLIVPAPGAGFSLMQAGLIEALLSFVFALIVLVVATADHFKSSNIFGFAIAFTVPALAATGGPISGGLFNPAIALGAGAASMFHGIPIVWEHLAMYLVGAAVGGLLAAKAFGHFEK